VFGCSGVQVFGMGRTVNGLRTAVRASPSCHRMTHGRQNQPIFVGLNIHPLRGYPTPEHPNTRTPRPEEAPVVEGIGIDIIEVERIERAIRSERFVARIFTPEETAECRSRGRTGERFAGRFAAKEAIAKALGRALNWREVEIQVGPRGEPLAVLSGRAAVLLGERRVRVSISHCHTHAVAQAVVVRE
jgi:holo-[acyl-carrier protein] synthase